LNRKFGVIMRIGAHVSISGSIELSIDRALEIECDTFQIFTRSPRRWFSKQLLDDKIEKFRSKLKNSSLNPVFSHIPYLVNLASLESEIWEKSVKMMTEELERCEVLNIPYVVTHLGSAKKAGKNLGIDRVISSLNHIFEGYNGKTKILLENTTGKGKKLGNNIGEICQIILQINKFDSVGLCFDTCHAFASGYDLRKEEIVEDLVSEIQDSVGIRKLLCIHSNDSLFDLGEGRDRHEHLGLGKIGELGFYNLIKNEKLKEIPFICETPVDNNRDGKENIKYLRDLEKKSSF